MPPDAGEPGLRLGYACLNTLFESPARTTRLAKATPERLRELLAANLDTLEAILRWNDANDIQVFRVSSNTVPLASHPRASYPWREALGERFAELGDIAPYPFGEGPLRCSLVRRVIPKGPGADVLGTAPERVAITVEQ